MEEIKYFIFFYKFLFNFILHKFKLAHFFYFNYFLFNYFFFALFQYACLQIYIYIQNCCCAKIDDLSHMWVLSYTYIFYIRIYLYIFTRSHALSKLVRSTTALVISKFRYQNCYFLYLSDIRQNSKTFVYWDKRNTW